VRKGLLRCGIASPFLYALADALAGLRWQGYSFRDQTISELGALGAPSRPLFASLLLLSYALFVAFGVGIRRAAGDRRRVRLVGSLVIALGLLALTVGQLAAMRPRGTPQGLAGTMHLIEGAVAMITVFVTMGVASTAFGAGFRRYTWATIGIVLALGAWTARAVTSMEAGGPTPWLGVQERAWWYAYQAWFAVLALTLLRERSGSPDLSSPRR
jgi:hypothetical membrane protein